IHHRYPANNGVGNYQATLPHIILNRSTLPWERAPGTSTQDDQRSPSWLALFLFTQDEIAQVSISQNKLTADAGNRDNSKVIEQTVQAGELESAPEGGVKWQPLRLEVTGQTPDDLVQVIDVPWKLLKYVLPTYHELSLIAHVRKVIPIIGSA